MPFFSYRCAACAAEFELLVRADDTPVCPSCGSPQLKRQLGAPALGGKTEAAMQVVRRAAAREGHLSNYSKNELKRR